MFLKVINIKGCKTAKQVSVMMSRYENETVVEITAWHTNEDGDYMQQEVIGFDDKEDIAKCFISDYSESTANKFANSFSF